MVFFHSSQLSAFSGQLSAVSFQRSAFSGQLSAVSFQRSAFSGQLSAVSGQLSAFSSQPGTSRHSSLAILGGRQDDGQSSARGSSRFTES
jgi:hypothetical protein